MVTTKTEPRLSLTSQGQPRNREENLIYEQGSFKFGAMAR
jgi:hypothetical protein